MDISARPYLWKGRGGPGAFAAWCAEGGRRGIRVVADLRTQAALGSAVLEALVSAGLSPALSLLRESEPVADATSVLSLLLDLRPEEELLVAVGSGTIADLVRIVAHRARRDFVSLPTAASVDAYSSAVAALVVEGVKRTFPAKQPLAIFADLGVLAGAPRAMTAAGFGDMFCKFSALADWRLGSLFWGEPYDAGIAARSLAAAEAVAAAAPALGQVDPGSEAAIGVLFEGLLESGSSMAEAGHSRPASGAEHQYSHFWEMRLLREGRPAILHGHKVAVGTLVTAGLWDRIRALSKEEAAGLLARARLPPREEELRSIESTFGEDAPEFARIQERFIGMDGAAWQALLAELARRWDEVLDIAARVPGEAETRRLLGLVGCPLAAADLGLGEAEVAEALSGAHWLRDRFTVRKLARILFELG